MLFIIDIDGTIADGSSRFALAGPEPERSDEKRYLTWVKKVNSNLDKDKPVLGMAELVHSLLNSDHEAVYVTGREERHRTLTVGWLEDNGFPSLKLIMRPNLNWSSNADFKEVVIATLRAEISHDILVIDDDEHGKIEAMCKRNGYTFLKARSGGQK